MAVALMTGLPPSRLKVEGQVIDPYSMDMSDWLDRVSPKGIEDAALKTSRQVPVELAKAYLSLEENSFQRVNFDREFYVKKDIGTTAISTFTAINDATTVAADLRADPTAVHNLPGASGTIPNDDKMFIQKLGWQFDPAVNADVDLFGELGVYRIVQVVQIDSGVMARRTAPGMNRQDNYFTGELRGWEANGMPMALNIVSNQGWTAEYLLNNAISLTPWLRLILSTLYGGAS